VYMSERPPGTFVELQRKREKQKLEKQDLEKRRQQRQESEKRRQQELEQLGPLNPSPAPKPSEPKAYIPDYRPVIKALRELVRAFEVIDNRGIPPPLLVPEEVHKRRSDSAKKRWETVPPERRRAITAAARTARTKAG
jgi:ribonuclease D